MYFLEIFIRTIHWFDTASQVGFFLLVLTLHILATEVKSKSRKWSALLSTAAVDSFSPYPYITTCKTECMEIWLITWKLFFCLPLYKFNLPFHSYLAFSRPVLYYWKNQHSIMDTNTTVQWKPNFFFIFRNFLLISVRRMSDNHHFNYKSPSCSS